MGDFILNVNGAHLRVSSPAEETLLSVLRNRLNLTGTKYGCGEGQCGYCTSGMILGATSLLHEQQNPTEKQIVEAMEGHICRCGTYPRIIEAVKRASHLLAEGASR